MDMRKILLPLVILFFFGCGSTKKSTDASHDQFSNEKETSSNSTQKATAETPKKVNVPPASPPEAANASKKFDGQNSMQNQFNDSIFATIERTPCYGKCPTYKITVYQDGYVLYEGKRFVEKIGKYDSRLSILEMQTLFGKAMEIGYFNMQDVYDSPVTDIPSTVTSLNYSGKRKAIKARHSVPPQLIEFQNFFDGMFAGKVWMRVEGY